MRALPVQVAYNQCKAQFSKRGFEKEIWVFHGTSSADTVKSICTGGFKVAGQPGGPPIANGAVYGLGFYAATSPHTPMGYGKDSRSVILCLALPGKPGNDALQREWRRIDGSLRRIGSSSRRAPSSSPNTWCTFNRGRDVCRQRAQRELVNQRAQRELVDYFAPCTCKQSATFSEMHPEAQCKAIQRERRQRWNARGSSLGCGLRRRTICGYSCVVLMCVVSTVDEITAALDQASHKVAKARLSLIHI